MKGAGAVESGELRGARGGGRGGGGGGGGRRRWRRGGGVLLVAVLLLVGARLALPWYLRSYVNRTLDQSPDYSGRVGTIDVHLWRGAYTIHDLNIVKRIGAVPVPFFESPQVDFSLNWGA